MIIIYAKAYATEIEYKLIDIFKSFKFLNERYIDTVWSLDW